MPDSADKAGDPEDFVNGRGGLLWPGRALRESRDRSRAYPLVVLAIGRGDG